MQWIEYSSLRESDGPVQNDGPDAAKMPLTGIDLLRMVCLLYEISGYQFGRLSWWPYNNLHSCLSICWFCYDEKRFFQEGGFRTWP